MRNPKDADASKLAKAPFNSNARRFGKITLHPGLDPNGLYTKRPNGCDPCLYNPKLIRGLKQLGKNGVTKDPWKYKTDLEDWAKNLGYRNQKILDQRKWYNSILGPAWHDVPHETKYEAACKNLSFGRTLRFKTFYKNIPGPGSYYKRVPFKSPYGPHSQKPTFENEEPCRFKDITPKWSLAPNRYNILDTESIELTSKKVVSLRGPYDLFTGKRDDSSIKNHFATSLRCSAATWPLGSKSTLVKYKNSQFGVMNKTSRNTPYRGRNTLVQLSMCLRKPKDPGPGHYDVIKTKKIEQNKFGFNSSYDKPPGYKRVIVWPGVGRYNPKNISCGIPGKGHRHVFLSKQKRTIGAILPEAMNSF